MQESERKGWNCTLWVTHTVVHAILISSPLCVPSEARATCFLLTRAHRTRNPPFLLPLSCTCLSATSSTELCGASSCFRKLLACFFSCFYHNSCTPQLSQLWSRNPLNTGLSRGSLLCRKAQAWSQGHENQGGMRNKSDSGIK